MEAKWGSNPRIKVLQTFRGLILLSVSKGLICELVQAWDYSGTKLRTSISNRSQPSQDGLRVLHLLVLWIALALRGAELWTGRASHPVPEFAPDRDQYRYPCSYSVRLVGFGIRTLHFSAQDSAATQPLRAETAALPSSFPAHFMLLPAGIGRKAHARCGHFRVSRQYSSVADACLRALEIGEASGEMERQLAELLFLSKRIEEARPLLERFYSTDSGGPRWAAMLSNLLAAEQEYENAVPMLLSSLALPGAPATVRLDVGRSFLVLDWAEEALPHSEFSLGLDEDGTIHHQLAQAFQRLGQREQGREAIAQNRDLDARARMQTEAGASLGITAPE